MLFLFMNCDPSPKGKETIREEMKKRTGEDCVILGPNFLKVCQFPVKKERTASPGKRLPWQIRR